MKRKTDRLMARVPDITIKDRTETETEEFGDEASEDGDSDIQRVSRGKVFIFIYIINGWCMG